jgi:hypothetical protein
MCFVAARKNLIMNSKSEAFVFNEINWLLSTNKYQYYHNAIFSNQITS